MGPIPRDTSFAENADTECHFDTTCIYLRNVVIIGGGLAGLTASIRLIRNGITSTVIEKKSYPLHRVCGEYVSNEALPFLKSLGLYPHHLELPQIKFFEISSVSGVTSRAPLDLGGFGISRFAFDDHLYKVASREGVNFTLNSEVTSTSFQDDGFELETSFGTVRADVVIGAFGKRSKLDVQMKRPFMQKRSPYIGVKYHVRSDQPRDLVSLHNFAGGYCGVCAVEDGITNLCYLTHRDNVKNAGDLSQMEADTMFRNPRIKDIFKNSSFVFERPEVINEISFKTKGAVEDHILMAGDAAGMITPVCGNGMAIAIRSGKIASDIVSEFCAGRIGRAQMEERYTREWSSAFARRLWVGRNVQRLFGNRHFSSLAVSIARSSEAIAQLIVRNTHGQPF